MQDLHAYSQGDRYINYCCVLMQIMGRLDHFCNTNCEVTRSHICSCLVDTFVHVVAVPLESWKRLRCARYVACMPPRCSCLSISLLCVCVCLSTSVYFSDTCVCACLVSMYASNTCNCACVCCAHLTHLPLELQVLKVYLT